MPLAHLRDGKGVLVRGLRRAQAGGQGQRGLGVVQEIHLEAHAPEPEEDLRIFGRELPGARPVREGPLQLPLALGHRGRLTERRDRARPQHKGPVVGLEGPPRITFHEVGAAEGEGQLVRRGIGHSGTLENLETLRDEASLDEELREAHGPGARRVRNTLRVRHQRGGGRPIPRLQVIGGEDEQSLGRLPERREDGLGQLQRALVVSLLGLGAGESLAGLCAGRVQLQDPQEEGEGQLGLSLERVDLRKAEVGPDEAWLEPDGFLEHLRALGEPVLLNANGTEYGTGRGARLGIGERPLGLLVGFLEPPFLGQDGRSLQRLARLGRESGPGRENAAEEDEDS